MAFKSVFVTVGTTEFVSLIATLESENLAQALLKRGCEHLTVQFGRSEEPQFDQSRFPGVKIATYGLKPSLQADIDAADLIISHAGAGSCIEVLQAGKPLIVVVNDELMGNHQTELATQLSNDGYLVHCTPDTLEDTLIRFDAGSLKPYTRGNMSAFIAYLDTSMGFGA